MHPKGKDTSQMLTKRSTLWTDVVGSMKMRASGPVWIVKPQQMQLWSFELLSRDVGGPWELFFSVKIGEDWIPMSSPSILGSKDASHDQCVEVVVLEGAEERVLVIDTTKHIFQKEPFVNSIGVFSVEMREDLEHYIKKGVTKMAINCILTVARDYTLKLKKESEALSKSKKKKATTFVNRRNQTTTTSSSEKAFTATNVDLSSRPDNEEQGYTQNTKAGSYSHETAQNITPLAAIPGIDTTAPNKQRKKPIVEIIALDDEYVDEVEDEEKFEEEDGDLKQRAKRKNKREATSYEKTKHTKKSKVERMHAEANVIPEREKTARDIKPGQEIDLDAAANDKKIFEDLFGKMYIFGMDFAPRIHVDKLIRGKSTQVINSMNKHFLF